MEVRDGRPSLSNAVDGYASSQAPGPPVATVYLRIVKPALDRLLGLVLLVILAPLMAATALLVLITLGRPTFHSQVRVGRDGRPFRLYKLRTMHPDRRRRHQEFAGRDRRVVHKTPDDPRHTTVGRFLRATRLDELPQLWNVVRGNMSLVGPRPELPEIVSRYEPWQHARHMVKPGVTGLWQISQHNGKPMHECTEIDLEYMGRIRFREDMRIILRTPLAMLGSRKGY